MKKITRFLSSMPLAVGLLVALVLGSLVGTLIPQNQDIEVYVEKYGMRQAGWMTKLSLDHVYSSTWYAILGGLLCLSILLCVIVRIKPLVRAWKEGKRDVAYRLTGSWILHVGILVTILFFGLGQRYAYDNTFYNVKGTVAPLEGTDLTVAIDDFTVNLRPDLTVDSYITEARILRDDEELGGGEIAVNHPLTVEGYQFSQASLGYAVEAHVKRFEDDIGTAILFSKEVVSADSGKLIIEMLDFFPDMEEKDGVIRSKTPHMRNPYAYIKIEYMGQVVGQDLVSMLRPLKIGEYTVRLTSPQYYTLLAVRKDPYMPGAATGALLLLVGLGLVFWGPKTKERP